MTRCRRRSVLILFAVEFMIGIAACSDPRQTIEYDLTRHDPLSRSRYSKIYRSKEFDLALSYVGMNDSSFTFEISLDNHTNQHVTLDCERSTLAVDLCAESFRSRIKSFAAKRIDINGGRTSTAWLQFRAEADTSMRCFLNGGKLTLSGIVTLVDGRPVDFGIFEFQPLSVRMH